MKRQAESQIESDRIKRARPDRPVSAPRVRSSAVLVDASSELKQTDSIAKRAIDQKQSRRAVVRAPTVQPVAELRGAAATLLKTSARNVVTQSLETSESSFDIKSARQDVMKLGKTGLHQRDQKMLEELRLRQLGFPVCYACVAFTIPNYYSFDVLGSTTNKNASPDNAWNAEEDENASGPFQAARIGFRIE